METTSEKIKLTLDECRMLVLGTQVLISLQFDLAFQSGFGKASSLTQHLVAVGLAFMLAAFVLLLWGPAYHRISLDAHISRDAQNFMTGTIRGALFPLSVAMGIDAFIMVEMTCGRTVGLVFGVAVFCFCCVAWYGFGWLARKSRPPEVIRAMNETSPPDEGVGKLHERVNQVMTEARVVLPGAQAMLGFQFITFFETSFQELPAFVRLIHLICASLIATTVVLLMTPAAFHRVAEAGEDSERLVTIASRCVIGGMIPLAMGMSGDFFVIIMKITGDLGTAIATGSLSLTVFLALWFGYTLLRRKTHSPAERPAGALARAG